MESVRSVTPTKFVLKCNENSKNGYWMLIGVCFYCIGMLFLVTTDFLLLAKNPFE